MTYTLLDLDHGLVVRHMTAEGAGRRRAVDCARNGHDFAVCKAIPTGEFDNRDHEIVDLDPDSGGAGDYFLASRKPGYHGWERTVIHAPLCESREEAERLAYTELGGVDWPGDLTGTVMTDAQFEKIIADTAREARADGETDILRAYGYDQLADAIDRERATA